MSAPPFFLDDRSSPVVDCRHLMLRTFEDSRGSFIKTFDEDAFLELGLPTRSRERYYSISRKDVLRGMHFQVPPHDHDKIVHCSRGRALDVVVDLRVKSPSYRSVASFSLDAATPSLVYVPRGCAHGFLSLEDECHIEYSVETRYAPSSDAGILWSSIDFAWPIDSPILSPRDEELTSIEHYPSPFE
jgi:dTDP-4-dehydrorhamnose 3,5-epimerase